MKVLHINYSDIEGGAARGAYWMHKALKRAGVESSMLVARKRSSDPSVYSIKGFVDKSIYNLNAEFVDSLPLKFYAGVRVHSFSPAVTIPFVQNPFLSYINRLDPDIINIHWAGHGLLSPEELKRLKKPIVWTLRDMWAFTGGCHYSGECDRYKSSCGKCPQLSSTRERDISRQVWNRKLDSWKSLNLTIAPISHWLAACAKESPLLNRFRIEVIHNALDTQKFKPINKRVAREILGLPLDKKLVLFGAISAVTDKRKGFAYVQAATRNLANRGFCDNTELVVFGSSEPDNPPELRLTTTYLGKLSDDVTLALTYSAADVTVVPSIQEAFGKTAIESLACGTPVVSFDSTGLKDIIDHKENGYRAACFSADDLANGIAWILANDNDHTKEKLAQNSRNKVEKSFSLEVQAARYGHLYQELLTEKPLLSPVSP
ncbi:MAG: glycosyltransferase family 4 protein [Cyanobacteria bacterium J06636_16]